MGAKVVKTDAEWQAGLSELAYRVTRHRATERAFSHDRFPEGPATYACICCGAALFDAGAKCNSGSGWPSFSAPLSPAAVGLQEDRSWFMCRTEVHCATCDAHLGHVFRDGPKPSGLRYCINGVALDHRPAGLAR